jgi:hypothetical protein
MPSRLSTGLRMVGFDMLLAGFFAMIAPLYLFRDCRP